MAQPPSAWTFTNNTRINLFGGDNDWNSDTFNVALFAAAASIGPAVTTYGSLTNEVSNGNGYTTGGITVDLALTGTTAVAAKFVTNPVWTGSGSGFSAYYAVLYAVVSGEVVCYCLLDSTPQNVVITAGATLTIANNVTALATLS